ncbi:Exocyst complex component 3 [Crotalus adamanteus]|uniref:Exocyst complex component 3 n=1 Tax=Crotalus adamanteus TaxID=8729 RepID=A0AAW1B4H5_CROAD
MRRLRRKRTSIVFQRVPGVNSRQGEPKTSFRVLLSFNSRSLYLTRLCFKMEETDREAVATAVQRVAGMLQRPDQLDKVEQYRRREGRKKASVEARLKAAIQSQLDGVRTGLSQLHTALHDVKDIQQSLVDVNKDWRQSINTIENLKDVKDAVVQHSQLAAAVENLKNIFSVPEIVQETQDLIEQGQLLQAHRKLMDLECSRDDLMYEQYRMDSKNTHDMNLIDSYFGDMQKLSEELAKQLWMDLASEDLEANEIVSLLTWVLNTYKSEEMMGNLELAPELEMNFLQPLLSQDVVNELLSTYMSTLTSNIIGWLRKALETDKKDWLKENEPEADQDGYYQTTLPAIVFQMFEQNLQVATQISEDLKIKVLHLCLQQMSSFLNRYKEEAHLYKEEHLRNRQYHPCYVQYMVAIINNCQTFKESIISLKKKYLPLMIEEMLISSHACIDAVLDDIAKEGCSSLLDEVFIDLEPHLSELMTKKWLSASNAVDTICVTVEDYFNDFARIKKPCKKKMTVECHRRVVMEYIKAIMLKRITFKNAEERKEGAERMNREAKQFRFLFKKLAAGSGEDTEGLCDVIEAIAEVFKLTDPSLLYLEISTLVSKHPDIREDHIAALLTMRGDASREMKQTIIETLDKGPSQPNPNYVPLFKEIVIPTLTVPKLLK